MKNQHLAASKARLEKERVKSPPSTDSTPPYKPAPAPTTAPVELQKSPQVKSERPATPIQQTPPATKAMTPPPPSTNTSTPQTVEKTGDKRKNTSPSASSGSSKRRALGESYSET